MQCDEVIVVIPELVDVGATTNMAVERHLQSCLRCQAEVARYRRLLRMLAMLRTRYVEPNPGLLGDTLAALADVTEQGARRTLLSGRTLAYAGAIGGATVAAGATAALLIARSRRRALSLAS